MRTGAAGGVGEKSCRSWRRGLAPVFLGMLGNSSLYAVEYRMIL